MELFTHSNQVYRKFVGHYGDLVAVLVVAAAFFAMVGYLAVVKISQPHALGSPRPIANVKHRKTDEENNGHVAAVRRNDAHHRRLRLAIVQWVVELILAEDPYPILDEDEIGDSWSIEAAYNDDEAQFLDDPEEFPTHIDADQELLQSLGGFRVQPYREYRYAQEIDDSDFLAEEAHSES